MEPLPSRSDATIHVPLQSRARERERAVVAETCGALLSRDGKGMSSTIDGKLVALMVTPEEDAR